MKKKKILITGAGTGIGLAITCKFLEQGWEVVAHYNLSGDQLIKLKKQNFPLRLLKANFAKTSEIKNFIKVVSKESFNILINNAAIYDLSLSAKNRISSIEDVLRVNMIAPALIAEALFQKMKLQKRGHIINISSIGAKYGSDSENKFYSMSKRGLESLTNTLAREGASFNIAVNTIRPGVIQTNFHIKNKRVSKQRLHKIPMKRLGKPEEIADFIFYLCDQQTFLTNQTIAIAGGE